jgi:hypothetical protein
VKTSFPWKQALVLFAAVLLTYLAVFNGIEYVRHRKGPWKAHFMTDAEGHPAIKVTQQHQKVEMLLEFPDERIARTNFSEEVAFDRPKKPVPYGKVIYEDLTFDLFGHEVELLPRVLIVNKRELRWETARVQLWATNKPPVAPKPAKGYE